MFVVDEWGLNCPLEGVDLEDTMVHLGIGGGHSTQRIVATSVGAVATMLEIARFTAEDENGTFWHSSNLKIK